MKARLRFYAYGVAASIVIAFAYPELVVMVLLAVVIGFSAWFVARAIERMIELLEGEQ